MYIKLSVDLSDWSQIIVIKSLCLFEVLLDGALWSVKKKKSCSASLASQSAFLIVSASLSKNGNQSVLCHLSSA